MSKKNQLVVTVTLLIIGVCFAVYFLFLNKSKNATTSESPQTAVYTTEDNLWELAAHLSALDTVEFPHAEKFIDEEIRDIRTADEIIEYAESAITINPAAGHLLKPTDMLSSGVGTSLDRSLLLKWLFDRNHIQSEILYLDQEPGVANVRYGNTTPMMATGVDSALAASVEIELSEFTDDIGKKISTTTDLKSLGSYAKNNEEKRVYWIRYQDQGNWINFLPEDTYVDSTRIPNGIVLNETELNAQSWKSEIKINNLFADGSHQNVLSKSFRSSDIHNTAITFFNKPVDSISRFNSELRVSEQPPVQGSPFSLSDHNLRGQEIEIIVTGPFEKRTFRRKLVELSSLSNNVEKAIEMACMVKLTQLNGFVSDDQFAYAVVTNLQHASRLLFGDTLEFKNLSSVLGVSLLDAIQRYSGQIGVNGKSVFSYRSRPSFVLENQYIRTESDGLKEFHSVDLIDPGHAILSSSKDTALRAAMEQSIIDGNLESLFAYRENAISSQQEIDKLLSSRDDISSNFPITGTIIDTSYQLITSKYFLGGQAALKAGWRIDPGPQLVPIFSDGSGGLSVMVGEVPRFTGDLCKDLTWMTMFIPVRLLPSDVLLNGFIKYQCKLAEALNKMADILSGLMGPNANADSTAKKIAELEGHIKNMGPELMKDIVRDAIWTSAIGAAARPLSRIAEAGAGLFKSLGRGVTRKAKETFGALRQRFAKASQQATKRTIDELRRTSEALKRQGLTREERRRFIRDYGCIGEGTMVLTNEGSVPIEEIKIGDLVISYNFKSNSTRENKVLNVVRYSPPTCATIDFVSGTTLQATDNHPFFVLPDSSWKTIAQLLPGDSIFSRNHTGFNIEIVNEVSLGNCSGDVYDLQVENDHNYFITASGVLVHNWDPEICKQNTEKFNKLISEGKTKGEAMKQMVPHPPVKEPKLYAGKKKIETPEGTAQKHDIEKQGKDWGNENWKERSKDKTQKKQVAEELGEAGGNAGMKKREGMTEVYTADKASGFPQGFDAVYKDKDGVWVVLECKGGYNKAGINSIMGEGYGHRQGSIGWLEGACKRVSKSPSTSAQEKKIAEDLYDAIHNGKVRIEAAHTKHRAGEPISTTFYELDRNY